MLTAPGLVASDGESASNIAGEAKESEGRRLGLAVLPGVEVGWVWREMVGTPELLSDP